MKKAEKQIRRLVLCLLCSLLGCLWAPAALGAEAVLGRSTQRLQACDGNGNTNTETDFGNFMADAIRWFAGADVAILPSGDLGNHLQQGRITESDLDFCLQRNASLGSVQMSPAQLYARLEHGISQIRINADETIDWDGSRFDGYLQISGISAVYDLAAPVGGRVSELKLSDGSVLDRRDRSTALHVVSTVELLEGGYGYPATEKIDGLETETAAATAYVRYLGTVGRPEGGRTTLMGARNFWNGNGRLIGGLIAVVGVAIAVSTKDARNRKKQRNRVQRGYETSSGDSFYE